MDSYRPSPVFYYDQSNIPLSIDSDPLCNRKISNIFVAFAGDYFFSQNIPQYPEHPRTESTWAEFVRGFLDQPAAINCVRLLSRLFEEINPNQFQLNNKANVQIVDQNLIQPVIGPPQFHSNLGQAKFLALSSAINGTKMDTMTMELPPPIDQPSGLDKFDVVELPTTVDQPSRLAKLDLELPITAGQPSRIAKLTQNDKVDFTPPAGQPLRLQKFNKRNNGQTNSNRPKVKRPDRACEFAGCPTEAGYNFEGETKRRFCAKHKLKGMVSVVRHRACIQPGCSRKPMYGYQGENYKRYCGFHKLDGMVNLVPVALCIEEGCTKRALCNYQGEAKKMYCSKHKRQGMVVLDQTICSNPRCLVSADFNYEGSKKGKFCSKHKMNGMVNIKTTRCKHPGCESQARYNFMDQKKPTHCARHQLKGMSCKFLKNCIAEGCLRTAYYNYEGEKARFCSDHIKEGMVLLRRKKDRPCRVAGCAGNAMYKVKGSTQPTYCKDHRFNENTILESMHFCRNPMCYKSAGFNFAEGIGKIFCKEHKVDGMVDKRNPNRKLQMQICENRFCKKYAWYNYEGLADVKFCKQHASKGMVKKGMKVCEAPTCFEVAHYNFVGAPPKFCKAHKLEGMEYLWQKTCSREGCPKQPSFNLPGERTPLVCGAHKTEGMVNVRNRTCEVADCAQTAWFNDKGLKKGRFCREHKGSDMVRIKPEVRCLADGCEKYGGFGFLNEKGRPFCKQHKLEGMVIKSNISKVRKTKHCGMRSCKTAAAYNFVGSRTPVVCSEHKFAGMVAIEDSDKQDV